MDASGIKWDDAPASGGIVWDDEKPKAKPQPLPMMPGAGVGDAAASIASSMVAAPVSGLAGLAGAILPGPPGQGADWVARTGNALTYAPRTDIGKAATAIVGYPGQKLAEWGDKAGGATADRYGPLAGSAVNTAIQSIPLALGSVASKIAPAGETAATLAKRQAAQGEAAQAQAGLVAARDAGYVVPPTQGNPSLLNKAVEGFGGKIKTAQALSEKNQPISNQLVRDTFGIPESAPLTPDSLALVRKTAGEAGYAPVRGSGRVSASEDYGAALDAIEAPYKRAAADFPKAKQAEIIGAVDSVRVKGFDAGSALDQIRIMRDNADTAYRGGDKGLGGAYKGIANALEEELGRHLERIGAPPEIINDYRNARQMIAETYTVQKHLQPNGNIDAKGLANELKKKPLTGNLRTVAEFGKNFPKAAQLPEKIGGVPMSPLDYIASLGSLGGAVMTGHPGLALGAAAPFLRPSVRKLAASDAYQNRMVGAPGGSTRMSTLQEQPLPGPGPSTASQMLALQEQPLFSLLQIGEGQRKRRGGLFDPSAAAIN